MENRESIAGKIKQRIFNNEKGKIYFIPDFYDLENDDIVKATLNRLEKQGILIRLAKGIYLYPKIDDELGTIMPPLEEIAKEIARRDKIKLLPTGVLALNILGLSTQVPTNVSYVTTGTPRQIKIKKRKITLKKIAPRYFDLKAKISPLLIFAIQEIGEKNLTKEIAEQLKTILKESKEIELLYEDLRYFPQWVRKYITLILNEKI